jgi:hypothetical protein
MALAGALLRADGISLSLDGFIWTAGAGGYGDGWGNANPGISIRQGGTLYIKYFSGAGDAGLSYADHGRKIGGWHAIGPMLADGVGWDINEPVILKITKIGTPESRMTWVNPLGKSGSWSGLSKPGPYDLALYEGAKWTSPPLVVTDAPKRSSFWARVLGLPESSPTKPGDGTFSVPDGGVTATLLAVALLSLALVRRMSA